MGKSLLAVVIVSFSPVLVAQLAPRNEDVVKMVRGGLGEDLIITTINASPGYYDTSQDGLAALKTSGVSDKVISALVQKAFQICFAGTAQSQHQGMKLGEMEELLQETGCGPRHLGVAPAAQNATTPNAASNAPGLPASTAQGTAQPSPSGAPTIFLAFPSDNASRAEANEHPSSVGKMFEVDCRGARPATNRAIADYTIALKLVGTGRGRQLEITGRSDDPIAMIEVDQGLDGAIEKACSVIVLDWARR